MIKNEYISLIIESCWKHTTFYCFRKIWSRSFTNYILLPCGLKEYVSRKLRSNSLSLKPPMHLKVLAIPQAFLMSILSAWFTYSLDKRGRGLQRAAQGQIQKQPFTCVLCRSRFENFVKLTGKHYIKVSANAMGIRGVFRTLSNI